MTTRINIKHDISRTRIARIWYGMVRRCVNPKDYAFKRYGGRGISVCKEWTDDVLKFKEWAEENGYKGNLTIDRIDNDGNYEPANCRWVSMMENSRNRCSTKLSLEKRDEIMELLKKGIKHHIIAKLYNVDTSLISHIKRGRRWA